jgi:hypothetical protein
MRAAGGAEARAGGRRCAGQEEFARGAGRQQRKASKRKAARCRKPDQGGARARDLGGGGCCWTLEPGLSPTGLHQTDEWI